MHGAMRVLLLGAVFVAAPWALGAEGVAAPLGWVAAAVATAVAVSGRASPLPVALGALGGLGAVALWPRGTVLAGAVLGLAVHGARALRAPSDRARAAALVLAACGGGVAAAVSDAYGGASDAVVRSAAVLVAGIVAAAAGLVAAEHPRTVALRQAAAAVSGDLARVLEEAAALHARAFAEGASARVDGPSRARIASAWEDFCEAVARRVEMERVGASTAARQWVDGRIAEGVAALGRVHEAAAEGFVRKAPGLDAAVRVAVQEGEALEAEAQAWREIARLDARA
jgi:hypothetical protein